MFEYVECRVDGPLGYIKLNRPAVLNAINRQVTNEAAEALNQLECDDRVRAIIVHGEGRAFSAGFDLSAEGAPNSLREWDVYVQKDYDFIMGFWSSPKPTIAAVHGFCLAGAFELALACDITIAAENTRFGEPEVRFGSGIVCMMLPWLANGKHTRELLLTGFDKVTAERAYEIGIVNRVVPDGEHLTTADAIARDIAAASRTAVTMTKRAINRNLEAQGLHGGLQAARDICVSINGMGDPEFEPFERIRKEQGLKAAIAWRDARYSF